MFKKARNVLARLVYHGRWRPRPESIYSPPPRREKEDNASGTLTAKKLREAILMCKANLEGRAIGSAMLRKDANATSGMEKHKIHLKRRREGRYTRHYLLAYALLRGKPYKRVEPHCHPGNEPDFCLIQDCLVRTFNEILPVEKVMEIWDIPDIRRWLRGEEEVQQAA